MSRDLNTWNPNNELSKTDEDRFYTSLAENKRDIELMQQRLDDKKKGIAGLIEKGVQEGYYIENDAVKVETKIRINRSDYPEEVQRIKDEYKNR